MLLAARVRHIFAEEEHSRIAQHLIAHASVEQVYHRRRISLELRIILRVELLAGRVDVRRVHAEHHRFRTRLLLTERVIGRGLHQLVRFRPDSYYLFFRGKAFLDQPRRENRHGIPSRIRFALHRRTVHRFIIRQRMGVRADNVRVH